MSFLDFTNLATDDYQKRDGNYSPKSNVPDSIDVYDDYMLFSFKNTSELAGKRFVNEFARRNQITYKSIDSNQSGDYEDDWIEVFVYPKDNEDDVEPVEDEVVSATYGKWRQFKNR